VRFRDQTQYADCSSHHDRFGLFKGGIAFGVASETCRMLLTVQT